MDIKTIVTCRVVCLAAGLTMVSGCSLWKSNTSNQQPLVAQNGPAGNAQQARQTPSGNAPRKNERIATAASESDAASAPTNQRRAFGPRNGNAPWTNQSMNGANGAQPAFIGLYGELSRNRGESRDPSDGAGNISQVSFATQGACFDPTVDPEGKRLAFASTMHRETADIYLKAVDGKTVTQLTSDPADDIMPAFSPDGSKIAFASNRSGNWDLYIKDVTGGRPVQLTNDDEHELHPSFSPDGQKVAYSKRGMQSGRWELWIVDVTNPTVLQFLDYGMFPQWSPDVADNRILFQRARERGSRYHSIWTIEYQGGEARQPTEIVSAANAATINPSWSPDGSRIVFAAVFQPASNRRAMRMPKNADIWMVNVNGTNRTNLTHGKSANYQPVWGHDGRVFFVSNRSGTDNIWAVSPDNAGGMSPSNPGSASDVATAGGNDGSGQQ